MQLFSGPKKVLQAIIPLERIVIMSTGVDMRQRDSPHHLALQEPKLTVEERVACFPSAPVPTAYLPYTNFLDR